MRALWGPRWRTLFPPGAHFKLFCFAPPFAGVAFWVFCFFPDAGVSAAYDGLLRNPIPIRSPKRPGI